VTAWVPELDKSELYWRVDADAIAELYRSYAPELVASLQRRFADADDIVEDAVQHAFLQLQTVATPPAEPRAWLRTVARNHVLDRLRANRRMVSDDDVIDDLPASTATYTADIPAISTTLVQRAMLLLTTRAQRVLRGKYQDGKNYDTLAEQEGLAKSGIGRLLDRARASLRRAVDEMRGRR
jgi:RNA polymerase sigma-70 factor (ECF subfamily)